MRLTLDTAKGIETVREPLIEKLVTEVTMTFLGPKNFVSDNAIQLKCDKLDESRIRDAEEVQIRKTRHGKGMENQEGSRVEARKHAGAQARRY